MGNTFLGKDTLGIIYLLFLFVLQMVKYVQNAIPYLIWIYVDDAGIFLYLKDANNLKRSQVERNNKINNIIPNYTVLQKSIKIKWVYLFNPNIFLKVKMISYLLRLPQDGRNVKVLPEIPFCLFYKYIISTIYITQY